MSKLESDMTVVGGGIAGLWCAKELIDQGLSVTLVEKSQKLANGATTRNEGWLHNGAYHSVGIDSEADAESVTERTKYGHEKLLAFAPESIEEANSYAFVKEQALVDVALDRWARFGVVHNEVDPLDFKDEGFNTDRISAAFKTEDKSVDSRILCDKLLNYIIEAGATVCMDAHFKPVDSKKADLIIEDEVHRIKTGKFLITAGTGTKSIYEELTGRTFPMRFFKSHLLITPRLTHDNFFYVDTWEAGMMSHGQASIIGFNKDSVEIPSPDYEAMAEKSELIYNRLVEMLPRVGRYALNGEAIKGLACVKPDAGDYVRILDTSTRQDLNVKVYEPEDGYICAIPGKMTEAPALGRSVREYLEGLSYQSSFSLSRLKTPFHMAKGAISASLRPADEWLQTVHRIPTPNPSYLAS